MKEQARHVRSLKEGEKLLTSTSGHEASKVLRSNAKNSAK
jgi:hypothetical protein